MDRVIKAVMVAVFCPFVSYLPANGQSPTKPKPREVLSEVVGGMPKIATQEIRVITAEFNPGDKTAFHIHRYPVTVYVMEGTFTLEIEDRKEPVVVKAGTAFVEPPGVRMTGYNRSTTERLNLVIFYVSKKGTPFLDVIDPGPERSTMRHGAK